HLLSTPGPAIFTEIVFRAPLPLRAHSLDMSAHLTRHIFKAEPLRFHKRFQEKNRTAVITAGVAPGLTNLLAKRAAEMLDTVEAVHSRLYESTESEDPISQWSAEGSFDEAVSRPPVYR